ncbi:hypothetical protein DSO57_1028420 [Entomophthora muscae]|uniref:Uncharacterized protein n=1 Tax=Entomophthora muscae TaxID=34485 RepID=A0ACC2S3B8_9FUNG|nr:hypothetical protein DSO57_1028420 [Entomophthora muscae]
MLEIPPTPPANILGLGNQVVPHTGSWCFLATAVNYLVRIAPVVYLAFQARPASPMGAQPDSVQDLPVLLPLRLQIYVLLVLLLVPSISPSTL